LIVYFPLIAAAICTGDFVPSFMSCSLSHCYGPMFELFPKSLTMNESYLNVGLSQYDTYQVLNVTTGISNPSPSGLSNRSFVAIQAVQQHSIEITLSTENNWKVHYDFPFLALGPLPKLTVTLYNRLCTIQAKVDMWEAVCEISPLVRRRIFLYHNYN